MRRRAVHAGRGCSLSGLGEIHQPDHRQQAHALGPLARADLRQVGTQFRVGARGNFYDDPECRHIMLPCAKIPAHWQTQALLTS